MTAHPRNFLASVAKVSPHEFNVAASPLIHSRISLRALKKPHEEKINIHWKEILGPTVCPIRVSPVPSPDDSSSKVPSTLFRKEND
jgi:hypothetical protein